MSKQSNTPDDNQSLKSYFISELEGKILTLIDASIADPTQRKALKDLARQTIWSWSALVNSIGPNADGTSNVNNN